MSNAPTQKPLVSVVMATYNRPKSTIRAIQSVQAQTYSHWELFVVDDCSTDDTEAGVRPLAEADSRITFIRLPVNQGQSAARNVAIERSRGEYVAFLDSDDEWLPAKLERQMAVFLTSPEEVGLVYTSAYFVSEDRSVSRVKYARESGDLYEKELAYNPIGAPSRVMVRRSTLVSAGGFDPELRAHEDWDLWIRMCQHCRAIAISEPLIYYVESNDSVSINGEKLIAGYETLWKKHGMLERSRSVRVIHFLRLGHRLCYYGATAEGRSYLRKAFMAEPWNLKIACIFLALLLPSRAYRSVTFFLMKHTGYHAL